MLPYCSCCGDKPLCKHGMIHTNDSLNSLPPRSKVVDISIYIRGYVQLYELATRNG